jgi:prepilin-type N-terminal cleavage/methylation domain-containing protein
MIKGLCNNPKNQITPKSPMNAINPMNPTNAINDRGFTLIELIVVMFILIVALTLSTNSFVTVLKNSKQQSKIAETEMEKIIGLEILRWDIEHAGYGLPWYVNDLDNDGDYSDDWGSINSGNGYEEADDTETYSVYDDEGNAPRAILGGDGAGPDINGSDYLVIKSTVVRNNDEAQKWTYLWNDGTNDNLNIWGTNEDMANDTLVIAIKPKQSPSIERVLMTYGANNSYFSRLDQALNNYTLQPNESFLLFGVGVGNDNTLQMPFNRADYYISTSSVPARCAPGTGVLEKAVLSQNTGTHTTGGTTPLIDCVADFQVIFGIDQTSSPDGTIDCYSNDLGNDLPTFDAVNVRNRVKEVRVYILAHEGQYDVDFTYGNNTIRVGDSSGLNPCVNGATLGRDFDFTTSGITNWQNYRWKVYTLVVKPENLKGE